MNSGFGSTNRFRLSFSFYLGATILGGLLLSACSTERSAGPTARYDLRGKVVSIDKKARQVVIDHEEIPGFMEAMVMPFTLRSEWAFDELAAGDQVQAVLVVAEGGAWLEEPVITKGAAVDQSTGGGISGAEPRPGAEVPDVSLINQNGESMRLSRHRGQALLVTFIYTRCPLPNYCPLMNDNFAEIRRSLRQDQTLQNRTQLLSVSIDPTYDTPPILREYGATLFDKSERGFDRWEFATGTPEDIRRLAGFFGLSIYEEKDQIIHSLRTAIISPDGRVYKIYRGNEWKPIDVLRDLRELLQTQG